MRRLLVVLGLLLGLSVLFAGPAAAHPLGNFTLNQFSGLRVSPSTVDVDYVLDLAEVPAFQVRSTVDADPAGWRVATCASVARSAVLAVDGAAVPLAVVSSALERPAGQAGLSTLRLGCAFRAAVAVDRVRSVSYRIGSYLDRVGWREITAVGDGVTLSGSTVPAVSRSGRLTAYPQDLLSAPLDQRSAAFTAAPGGTRAAAAPPAAAPAEPLARGVDRFTAAFTGLVARRDLTVAFGLVALALSVLLGALHALAPGHGKTVMAAYLVGGRGSLRQALTIGLTVTATHTAGVLVLGTVLTSSVALAPQTVYPWLGIASGLILAGVGFSLFRRARAGGDITHSHTHSHAHSHEVELVGAGVGHGHGGASGHGEHHHHGDRHHQHGRAERRGGLLALGFAGGLVPSPSALVVLLGAVALGRTWFGILLVVGYGAGMAAALMGIGLLLSRSRRLLERRALPAQVRGLARWLPVGTAGLVVLVGVGLAVPAAAALAS